MSSFRRVKCIGGPCDGQYVTGDYPTQLVRKEPPDYPNLADVHSMNDEGPVPAPSSYGEVHTYTCRVVVADGWRIIYYAPAETTDHDALLSVLG